jgi:uncharacterized protein YjbJ (UPF0337 family)
MLESTDAFKRFAGDKSWGQLDFQTQQQIRLMAILEQSTKKYGDEVNNNTGASIAKFVALMKDLGKTISETILPIINDLLQNYIIPLATMFKNLSPTTQENIVKFALLAAAIGPVIMIIGTLLTTVSKIMKFGKVLAGALAGIQAGTLGVGAAMTTVFGPAGIVLLIAAAVAALVAGLVWLWNNNETFKNGVIAIWNTIYTFLEPLILAIKDLLVSTWEAINAVLNVIFNIIKALALQVFNDLKNFWAYWGQDITNYFMNMWNTISGVFKGAINVVSGLMKVITGILTGDWSKALEGMKQVASGIWEAIKAIFKGGANGIIAAVNFMIGGLNSISIDVPDWVPLAGGKHFGLSIPKIPMLADGGITTGPTLAMVGEGREDEAIIPLSKLQTMLDINKDNQSSYNGPLFVIENFTNNTDMDIENLMYQMEFYRKKANLALGGE